MPHIRIKSGEKVSLRLTAHERQLVLAHTFAPPNLTNLLRFGTHEGNFSRYRLTPDELEELLGYIAAEANHTKVPKRQRDFVRILERIDRELERHLNEASQQQESNSFPSSMPPELATAITKLISAGEFESLDEVNAALSNLTHEHNTRGNPDFSGLSPESVGRLIYTEWGSPDNPMRLNHAVPHELLLRSRLFQNARTFLNLGLDARAMKATATGNLNREAVGRMLNIGVWPEIYVDRVMRCSKVVNEQDIFPLHVLRIILELAGLVQRRKGFFKTTKAGSRLLEEGSAGELFAKLFLTYFRKFNIAYEGRLPEFSSVQDTFAYSLYAVSKRFQHWTNPDPIANTLFLPVVCREITDAWPFDHAPRTIAYSYILRPLEEFGLLQNRAANALGVSYPDSNYKKSPLFDAFIAFDFGSQSIRSDS